MRQWARFVVWARVPFTPDQYLSLSRDEIDAVWHETHKRAKAMTPKGRR